MKLELMIYYCGPNRRSEKNMIEAVLRYEESEPDLVGKGWESARHRFQEIISEIGAASMLAKVDFPEQADKPMAAFCHTAASIALLLQKETGHEVCESFSLLEEERKICRPVFDHEDYMVGQKAAILALNLLEACFPAIDINYAEHHSDISIPVAFSNFKKYSVKCVQPLDTSAIVQAADRQDVPVIKLERGPYEGVKGDFRLRMNSMLMLGHTRHLQVIDGTFAIEKSAPAYDLLFDRKKVRNVALKLQMPVPPVAGELKALISGQRAMRAATEIGYPVVIKTASRRKAGGTTLNIRTPEDMPAAVTSALHIEGSFVVEGFIEGETWKLLVANHVLIAVICVNDGRVYDGDLHPSIVQLAVEASRKLNVGLLELTIVGPSLSTELKASGSAVVDMELSPRLDDLLRDQPELMETAAEQFVRWLVPAGAGSRVPVIAVTGTNGKTTTCRMLSHIFQTFGQVSGMQCTDGRYINGELVEEGDNSIFVGHYRVFEDKSVEVAVLEAHLRGIAVFGLAFNHCEVAICTNVSQDHLGEEMIDSVDEVTTIKEFLITRATDTAVLNADNARSLSMVPAVQARRTCLVSLEQTADNLERLSGGSRYSCTLESREGIEWIVINDGESTTDIVATTDIPATFNGAARQNVANAMHAIAGAHAMGQSPTTIRSALSTFSMSVDNTPSRLNFYDGLPFEVMVDYAHNPDGVFRAAEFAGKFKNPGNKIVVFSGDRQESQIQTMAKNVAGTFDHYILKEYTYPENFTPIMVREPGVKAELAKTALLESGIRDDRISVVIDEMEAVQFALDSAKPGDLVVLLLGRGVLPKMKEYMAAYISAYSDKQ